MIRRELQTKDSPAQWLLISQVEHARLAGILAAHWSSDDMSPYACNGRRLPESATREILTAVTHHDDGWAAWERMPGVDPKDGRPYSFMNELPLEESLSIWDGSIAAARQIGPLAGWMVAGHFAKLLESGHNASDASAAEWLKRQAERRRHGLAEWQQKSKEHSRPLAERGLRLLRACDFLSLWLCCECAVVPDQEVSAIPPFTFSFPETNAPTYRFDAGPDSQPAGWRVTAEPWPFSERRLELGANASVAAMRPYESGEELLAALSPLRLHWVLES